ncbi:hypothetical protein [Massiliimalia massiliensis]|uniref:hypothetical protein n=1 Tax=Massiliimalia massiliensis TaxID=1852384 RepID=UPI00098722AB|nr:hypothetical protein [Massiliimalia massiliensis]
MINTLKQIANMKASLWVNAFIFYFKRLWLIGKCMPDSFYSDYSLKKALSWIAVVIRQIIDFFGKPLYLLFFAGLPLMLFAESQPGLKGREFAVMVHILFFLSCIIGAFGDSNIFSVTRDKVTFIKYMHMNAGNYIHASFAFKYVPFFVYYLPSLIAAALLLGASVLDGLLLWLLLLSFRMLGEAFQLFYFDRTGKVLSRNMLFNWLIIIAGVAGAYLLPAMGMQISGVLLHPAFLIVSVILGGLGFYYIAIGYKQYEEKIPHSLDLNFLLSSLLKVSSGATFKDVEIKETDAKLSEANQSQFQHLKGYAYFNALFFARHRRQLIRPVIYRLLLAVILFIAAAVFFWFNPERAEEISQNLTAILPAFVFIMYFMTVADKASRAMFFNCDKDMLHYAYYRNPNMILQNFKARLFRVSLYDLAIAAVVCLAAIGFCLICGTNIFTVDMLLFCLSILLLSILFTTHHLCLYYIFQPYSESLQIKNPFFTVINTAIYMLCFLCLQINVGGFAFTMTVLGFTVVYIAAALILVYRRAPRSFRVK